MFFLIAQAGCQVKYDCQGSTKTFKISVESEYDVFNTTEVDKESSKCKWEFLIIEGPLKRVTTKMLNFAQTAKKVTLPDSVERIEEEAILNLYELEEFHLPKNCVYVGKRAFDGCSSLENFTYYSECITFDDEAFSLCISLANFINAANGFCVEGQSSCYFGKECFNFCNLLHCDLPSMTTRLGVSCFEYNDKLVSIKLPEKITEITDSCFWKCTNLYIINLENIKSF